MERLVPEVPQDGNSSRQTPTGIETNAVGLLWGCKTNVEIKMHFTVMTAVAVCPVARQNIVATSFESYLHDSVK